MLKVVVFCSDAELFDKRRENLLKLGLADQQIVFLNSTNFGREVAINQNESDCLFFIDADCEVTATTLVQIDRILEAGITEKKIVSGLYVNAVSSNLFQKTHNFIANTWLQSSFENFSNEKYLLGGVFLFCSPSKEVIPEGDVFWGAEDKLLASKLNQAGYNFHLDKDLYVIHHTNGQLKHFIRRAYLHGKNEVRYLGNLKKSFKVSYWISKIGFSNLNLVPLLLVHFCIQKVAKWSQKIRPMSTQKMSL